MHSKQLACEDKAGGKEIDMRSNSLLNLSLSHENNLQCNKTYSAVSVSWPHEQILLSVNLNAHK